MTTLVLSDKLLTVLVAVKQKKDLSITESFFETKDKIDWHKTVKEYFFNLPQHLIEDLGLKRNERCFISILFFNIPEEWFFVESDELKQFTFYY